MEEEIDSKTLNRLRFPSTSISNCCRLIGQAVAKRRIVDRLTAPPLTAADKVLGYTAAVRKQEEVVQGYYRRLFDHYSLTIWTLCAAN